MNPAYFVDSISLIQAYAPTNNAIHLISKYDNLLPFLAKKYSAMPFFDLQWFLLTDKEVNLCIERIQTQKPPYLFVDTDIERDLNGEIVAAELRDISGPEGESLMRVQRSELVKGHLPSGEERLRAGEARHVTHGLQKEAHERTRYDD